MRKIALALVCGLVLVRAGWSTPQREGPQWIDLAMRKPPPPSDVAVLVIPFWARDQRQVELARGAVLLNLTRHGFKLVPEANNLPAVAQRTDALIKSDSEREPGARPTRADTVRIGKAAGARWAVYGEVERLETERHRRFFRNRKVGAIDIRLVLVDVASGETLYWSRIRDTGSGGTGFASASASSIERHLLTRTVNGIFADLSQALPPHGVGPEVTEDQVLTFIGAMGQ